ncbi:unnamed protein product [Porites evermanni]|uniref:Uncharacterized protein n=1 Tax=Porites evermanni TaxID=104178 RepID=A0ABN8SKE3_9CNID|nr:unnamed protein product [Porites evermanni]
MLPWKVAYLEALVALRDDLNLPPAEVPSLPTICRTLLRFDTPQGIKSSPGEIYTREECSTKEFCKLATNCRSEEAVFCR